jgi:hypothetical protein
MDGTERQMLRPRAALCARLRTEGISDDGATMGPYHYFTSLAAFQGTDALAGSIELGMVGMTRGIAREYGKHNIAANCIGAGASRVRRQKGDCPFRPAHGTRSTDGASQKKLHFLPFLWPVKMRDR